MQRDIEKNRFVQQFSSFEFNRVGLEEISLAKNTSDASTRFFFLICTCLLIYFIEFHVLKRMCTIHTYYNVFIDVEINSL